MMGAALTTHQQSVFLEWMVTDITAPTRHGAENETSDRSALKGHHTLLLRLRGHHRRGGEETVSAIAVHGYNETVFGDTTERLHT